MGENSGRAYTISAWSIVERTTRPGLAGTGGRGGRARNWANSSRDSQRLFLKRLNRLTLCFSKKLENLEAAFAMFAAWYNWCWQTRKPGKSGEKRPTACMMAGLAGHVWSFDELFVAVLSPASAD